MSAKTNVPWSVKGIDPDARSVAKELARREGKTLGEWMTAMIREKGLDEAGLTSQAETSDKVVSGVTTDQLRDVIGSLNRLTERIGQAEKNLQLNEVQARQAMGGLNKGLETVFERVKRLEREPSTDKVDLSEIADIAERLDRLEGGGKTSWVDSLKALERALTTLVDQVEVSREDTEERLTKNEDVLATLKHRLDEDDEELRREVSQLLEAIDRTTERVAATEERVSEALDVAREAAESHDETFIERTSNNLRLLGSEIKRTSDQIRTLETSVDKLQDKIEAGEQRSAEGISRVAQSLDNLRHQIDAQDVKTGPRSTASVRASVNEAEKRIDAVQGAFSAMVDHLEGRVSTVRSGSASDAGDEPSSGFGDDPQSSAPAADQRGPSQTGSSPSADPFDQPFDDPLGFSPRSTPEPSPDDSSNDPTAMAPRLAPPFGGLTGPGTRAAGNTALAVDDEAFYGQLEQHDGPEPQRFAASPNHHQPEREQTADELLPAQEPLHTDQDYLFGADRPNDAFRWDMDVEPQRDPEGFADADDEDRSSLTERMSQAVKRRFARNVENNPSLGWVLMGGAVTIIAAAAIRLAAPDNMNPVIVPTPTLTESPAEVQPTITAADSGPNVATLYTTAKERLATATTGDERRRAVEELTLAAERGSSVAQHDLGELYLTGTAVPMDGNAARRWLSAAADNGHLPSVNRLAYLDIKGIGGPVDESQAIRGFSRAAQAGFTKAMVNLGTLYNPDNAWLNESQRSAAESYYWFKLAELRGDGSAEAEARQVRARLAPDVRQAVETRASAWRPVPLSR